MANLRENKLEIVSGSIFLFPSASKTLSHTAISASTPQILAVTCSSNLNNRLVPPNNTSSFSIISFSTGSNQQRLILRYLSGSYDKNHKIKSATPSKYLHKTTGARDKYVDIPILNNDDSLTVAYKTVNALSKTSGYNNYFSASLDSIGFDEVGSTGVGSVEIGDDFIVGQYPGGTGLDSYSSSLGINKIGSTFRIRAGDGIGDISIGSGFVIGSYETLGTFKIFNFLSGSVGSADFSGSMVQVGGMMIGSSFKIGGSTQLFQHNIIQTGSGNQSQPFYEGDVNLQSASLGILIDPVDKISAMITGSNQSASLYFSASGQIGVGTTEPQSDFDIAADQFQVRSRRDSRGIFINEEGNIESFNRTTEGATTGSEFIMSYSRGGTSAITAQLVSLVLFGGSSPGIRGRDPDDEAQFETDMLIEEIGEGSITTFLNREHPDVLRKILDIGEQEGVLGTKAAAGDILGSLRWVADSGSFDQKYYEHRGGGEMLKIQGQVVESTEAGIRGDMLFFTSPAVQNAPVEVMRIASDGRVSITGSLSVSTAITSSIVSSSFVFIEHLTSSQNISASGEITAKSFRLGDGRIYFPANNSIIYANNAINFAGTDPYIFPNSNITASGDISASGKIHSAGYFKNGVALFTNPSFTGNVTASGDLSSSGTITAANMTTVGRHYFGGFGGSYKFISVEGDNFILNNGGINTTGRIQTLSHITASGDISASGEIVANSFVMDQNTNGIQFRASNGTLFNNILTNSADDFIVQNLKNGENLRLRAGQSGNKGKVIIQQGGTSTSIAEFGPTDSVNVKGNITASGAISSSGLISAANFHVPGQGRISFDNTDTDDQFIKGQDNSIIIDGDDKIRVRADHTIDFEDSGNDATVSINPTAGHITASGNISSSGNLYANNVGPIYDDYIYLTPTDFDHLRDKSGVTISGEIESNGGYIADNGARSSYYAQKIIPKGYRATAVMVKGSSDSDEFRIYSSSYDVGTIAAVDGGAENINTEKALATAVQGGNGVYCSIEWTSRGNTDVYGGYIKIVKF